MPYYRGVYRRRHDYRLRRRYVFTKAAGGAPAIQLEGRADGESVETNQATLRLGHVVFASGESDLTDQQTTHLGHVAFTLGEEVNNLPFSLRLRTTNFDVGAESTETNQATIRSRSTPFDVAGSVESFTANLRLGLVQFGLGEETSSVIAKITKEIVTFTSAEADPFNGLGLRNNIVVQTTDSASVETNQQTIRREMFNVTSAEATQSLPLTNRIGITPKEIGEATEQNQARIRNLMVTFILGESEVKDSQTIRNEIWVFSLGEGDQKLEFTSGAPIINIEGRTEAESDPFNQLGVRREIQVQVLGEAELTDIIRLRLGALGFVLGEATDQPGLGKHHRLSLFDSSPESHVTNQLSARKPFEMRDLAESPAAQGIGSVKREIFSGSEAEADSRLGLNKRVLFIATEVGESDVAAIARVARRIAATTSAEALETFFISLGNIIKEKTVIIVARGKEVFRIERIDNIIHVTRQKETIEVPADD